MSIVLTCGYLGGSVCGQPQRPHGRFSLSIPSAAIRVDSARDRERRTTEKRDCWRFGDVTALESRELPKLGKINKIEQIGRYKSNVASEKTKSGFVPTKGRTTTERVRAKIQLLLTSSTSVAMIDDRTSPNRKLLASKRREKYEKAELLCGTNVLAFHQANPHVHQQYVFCPKTYCW